MKLFLLAQQANENPTWIALRDSMRKEGEYTRQGRMGSLWMVLGFVALVIIIVWAANQLRAFRGRTLGAQPRKLFQRAARSVGIGALNRFLLLRAACASHLEHPAVMLITPQLMETHAGEWADHFPITSLRRFLRSRVNQIAAELFGTGDTNVVGG